MNPSRPSPEHDGSDFEHQFCTALCKDELLQSVIPTADIQAVADVGAGSGAWIRDFAATMEQDPRRLKNPNGEPIEYVAFDINNERFPETRIHGIDFVVHDMTEPFIKEYHKKFDIVHVRAVCAFLNAKEAKKAVENLVKILRPGGYLDWTDVNINEAESTTDNDCTQQTRFYLVEEMLATGYPVFFHHVVGSVKAMPEVMRVVKDEHYSTKDIPSPFVREHKDKQFARVCADALHDGAHRRTEAGEAEEEYHEETRVLPSTFVLLDGLLDQAEEMEQLVVEYDRGEGIATVDWDLTVYRMVAQKLV